MDREVTEIEDKGGLWTAILSLRDLCDGFCCGLPGWGVAAVEMDVRYGDEGGG